MASIKPALKLPRTEARASLDWVTRVGLRRMVLQWIMIFPSCGLLHVANFVVDENYFHVFVNVGLFASQIDHLLGHAHSLQHLGRGLADGNRWRRRGGRCGRGCGSRSRPWGTRSLYPAGGGGRHHLFDHMFYITRRSVVEVMLFEVKRYRG